MPVFVSVQRLFGIVREVARRAVLYLHILTGVGFGAGSWFEQVVLAAASPDVGFVSLGATALATAGTMSIGTALAALASTVQFGFYGVEDVMLGYLRALLRHVRNRPSLEVSAGDMLLLSSSVLYNSMHDGTYDSKVQAPGGVVCMHLAHVFGDTQLPLGRFAFHACRAGFALHRAALHFGGAALSMVGVSECACRNSEISRLGDLSVRCATRIPDAFREEFDAFVRTSRRQSEVCERMLERIERELNGVPLSFFAHCEAALDALRGVPQQVAAYAALPVFSELSCASYTSSAESAIMLPRPIAEFRRCAFTQTCAGRCAQPFDAFHAAVARVEADGVPAARDPEQSEVRLPIAPWTTPEDRKSVV